MKRPLALLLAACMSLAACQSPEQKAKEELQEQVAEVRQAAEAGDGAGASVALAALRTRVAELRQNDLLSEQEAQRILVASLRVQAGLALLGTGNQTPLQPPIVNPVGDNSTADGADGEDGEDGEDGKDGEPGRAGDRGKESQRDKGKGNDRDD